MLIKIKGYLKEKKTVIIIVLLLFILFIFSLVLKNYFLQIYVLPILFFIFIFIFIQYFDLDFKYSIAFALVLIIICPFLIAYNHLRLAEYFGNYFYSFLFIGLVNFFLDGFREKLKKINKFKIYQYVFLSIFVVVMVISGVTVLKDMARTTNFNIIVNYIKNSIKTINKNAYYSKVEEVTLNKEKLKEQIIINIDNLSENSEVSNSIEIKGSAIEKNAIESNGIDKIKFFIDGKPGDGKYLGYYEVPAYEGNRITKYLIQNTYLNILKRQPFEQELNYWAVNLEYNIISYQEFIGLLFNSREFRSSNISNKKFVDLVYNGILGRKPDIDGYNYWVDQLDKSALDRNALLNTILDTDEFKKRSDDYYKLVEMHKGKLTIYKGDIGNKCGKQFYLSGFIFNFDSTKFPDGQHTLYVYAHSPIFGWDYKTLIINIKN